MTTNNKASGRLNVTLADRQAAERKLCRLFESFGVDATATADRLIEPFIARAAGFWRSHAGLDFAALAVDEAEFDLAGWFADVLGAPEEEYGYGTMIGRAAFLMCGGPERWADVLLVSVDRLPAAFVEAMRGHRPMAVPPSEFGEMDHQPYEAWSVQGVLASLLAGDSGMAQGFSSLMRRDGWSFGWRNSRPMP